jgi:hypothetical protein
VGDKIFLPGRTQIERVWEGRTFGQRGGAIKEEMIRT